MHVLKPAPESAPTTATGAASADGSVSASEPAAAPACGCGRLHLTFGETYQYCSCGLSKNQPFCDGESHVGTPFSPLSFTVDKAQTYYLLCGCKRTANPPFCDGAHVHIDYAALEW